MAQGLPPMLNRQERDQAWAEKHPPRLGSSIVLKAVLIASLLGAGEAAAQSPDVTLSLGVTTVSEGGGTTDVAVTAELSAPRAADTTVTVTLAGTATLGADYSLAGALPTIVIRANSTSASATLFVAPKDDTVWEGDESILVGGTVDGGLTAGVATLTLEDNDPRPIIQFSIPATSIDESETTPTRITISAVLVGQATLETDLVINFALPSGPYRATFPTITIAPGTTSGSGVLVFTPVDDMEGLVAGRTLTLSATATDSRGNSVPALNVGGDIILSDDDYEGQTNTLTTVAPTVIRKSELDKLGQGESFDVSVTVASFSGRALDSALRVRISLAAGGCIGTAFEEPAGGIFPSATITLPQGTPSPSGTATFSLMPRRGPLSSDCELTAVSAPEAGRAVGSAATLHVISEADAVITGIRLQDTRAIPPPNIASLGEIVRFSVLISRFAAVLDADPASATLTFQLDGTTRDADCSLTSKNLFLCSYSVQAGEVDLDGPSLAQGAFQFEDTLIERFDPSRPITVDTTIPAKFLGERAIREDYAIHGARTSFELVSSLESLQEGASPTDIKVTATLVAGFALARDTSVPILFSNGTTTDADYTVEGSMRIPIPAGQSSGSVTLSFAPTDDGAREAREEYLRIEGASSEHIVVGTDFTIIDAPTIKISATPSEVTEDGGAQAVMVTAELGDPRDTPRARPIRVRLATSGSAGPGDYTVPGDLAVTIPALQRSGSATLNVTPIDDNLLEGDETIILTGTTEALSVFGAPEITLRDDERVPQVILSVAPTKIDESDTEAKKFTVSARLHEDVTLPDTPTIVSLSLGGTATEGLGGDYLASWDSATPQIVIPQGERTGSATAVLTVTPLQDELAEGNETIVAEGIASTGLVVDVRTSVITLVDDDAADIVLDPPSVEVIEGGSATYSVALSREPTESVTVTITTPLAGTDLAADNTQIVFTPDNWSTSQPVNVRAAEDDDAVADEPITLVHVASGGAYEGTTTGLTVVIKENDAPNVVVSPTSLTIREGGSGTYELQLTSRPTETVTVQMTTDLMGTDLTATPTTLRFTRDNWTEKQTVSLMATSDADAHDEPEVTLTHSVSGGDYDGVSVSSVKVSIIDTTVPQLSVADSSAQEGANVSFVVSLTPDSPRTVQVGYATADGTAQAPGDYTAASGSLTFQAGQTSKSVTVSTANDAVHEGNENFQLALSNPVNATIKADSGTADGTITDNDAAPTGVTLGVSPATALESADATSITVTASLVGSQRTAATEVTVSQTGGTAASGTDYAAISNFTITIAAGQSSGTATLSFDPTEDMLDEDDETVVLTARGPPSLGLAAGTATLTITDNDDAPTAVTLGVSPASALESADATSITVTASLVGSLRTAETKVTVSQTDGTATSGSDYAAISAFTVTIAAGESSGTATLSFDPTEDMLDEDDETVVLTGAAPGSLNLTAGTATLTITDNDDAPTGVTLGVSPSSAAESANATDITVTATLVGSQRTSDTAVTVSRTAGTATSGTDYAAISNFTVTIAAGASSGTATLSFDPTEDMLDEDDETVVLTGAAPSSLGLSAGTATLTITDNDDAPTGVTLGVSPSSAAESANATDITVTATLVGSQRTSDTAVTVSQTGGTATSGSDYDAISAFTVTIAAGQSSGTATLSFDPTEDMLDEDDETVVLTGAAPSSLGLNAGTATLTITDNDDAPTAVTLGVSPATAAESAAATSITVTASLVGSLRTAETKVTVSQTDGTATSGSDYAAISAFTVTIAAGESSGTATLSFDPTEDLLDEDDETVVLTGAAPSSLNLTAGTATLTITDNDDAPTGVTLGVSPSSAAESAAATSITVTASLVGSLRTAETKVTVSQTDGTATSGSDYAAISAFTVTIAAGARSGTATLSFDPTEDMLDEDNETVILTGAAPSSLGLSAGTATLTITDNDDAPTGVTLRVSPSSAAESANATDITVTASLVGSLRTAETKVTVSQTDGTATSGSDYAAISAFTVTIAAGQRSGTATLSFDPTEDQLDEDDETVVLTGAAPSSLGLNAGTATLTITDNDDAPTAVTLGVSPATAAESAAATDITVTASLVGSLRTAETKVTVSQTDGTATSGSDYAAISAFTVTIAAGASSGTATLSFDPTEDLLDEDDETVVLTGAAPSSLNLTAGTATLTITDNDDAPTGVTLGVSPSSAAESANATDITVTATLVGSQRTAETKVTVSQTDGTATSGSDYAAISAFTVTIAAGTRSGTATLSFDPTEDMLDEDNETVILTGAAPSSLGLSAGTATLTITDNDDAPTGVTLRVSPSSAAESANATDITVTASLVGSLRTAETKVTVSQTDGTATSGSDYAAISAFTVTIAAGARSGTATLSFDPTEDLLDEDDETVVLTGAAPSSLNLTAGTATLTITDNDDAPTGVTLGVSPSSAAESASATSITVTASLVGSLRTAETKVTVSQTDGTATSGSDYAAISAFTVTIAAGASSGTATLSFDPTEDTIDEANETVVLTGSAPSALNLTAGTATLTITDNDDAPTGVTLGVSPSSAAESASATSITVTASLVGSLRTAETKVTVSQTDGTATSGSDYAAISAFTVTIAAGARSGTATLSFDPTEDTIDEANETVILTGAAPSSLGLSAGTATLTITDNDDAPTGVTLRVSPTSAAESANATDITVTASLVGSLRTAETKVTVSQTDGTATSGSDYAAISAFTVTIAAGESSGTATLSFDPTEDMLDEDNETVILTGAAPSSLGLSAGTATLTITDNDDAPTGVTLGVSPSSAAESASATSITVTASLVGSQRTAETKVTVSQTDGTATSGSDYAAISAFTVTIAAGASSGTATLSFDPTEDMLDEDDETVVLTARGPPSLGLAAGTATLTITDNDDAPTAVTLGVSPASALESADATSITVTASLVGSLRTAETKVTVSQTDGTATSGSDYAAISAFTVTIAAGASSGTATLSFDPTEDMLDEDDETVVLTAKGPPSLGLAAGTATLTITDNDDAPTAVTLGVSPASALESADATSITVTASLVGSQRTADTKVTVSQTDGTATSGSDYAAISAFTVTIAAGASSGTATLSFDPTEDLLDEDDETVVLTGAAPSSLNLTAGTATLTITDNDDAPTGVTLRVSPSSAAESANATDITVTASLVGSLRTAETKVTVSQTDGTATSGSDYAAISAFTVTIAAGESSGTATLSFDPTEDMLDEDNETVILTGAAPSSLGLSAGTATLTITDNDDAPTGVTLRVSPSSAAESANATDITVTASLVGSLRTAETKVTVSQTDGTATSGSDYAAISAFTVTIAAGARSGTATLSFDPTEDTIDEANETVVLTGSAPSALSLTAGTATLTITDNDDPPTAVGLAVSPASVAESANATSITVTASLVGSQRTEATEVTVTRSGGTATSGTDYAAITAFTVTIAAGAMSGTATLSFDPTEDTIDEANETVVLTGSAPSALSLTAGTATLTITDNDDPPTAVGLAVSPSSVAESANATSIKVTASLVGSQRTEATAVTVTQSSGTATSGTDYAAISDFTVTIAAGAMSGTATLSFDPTEDTIDEANETVVLTGSAPSALSLTAGTATLTITDNDDAPTAVGLAVSPSSVAESANATSITVTASLVGSQRTEATEVTVTRSGGTATSGTDYAAISDFTVTIAAGASSGTATLSFDPTEDTLDEDNETVVLTGSAPSGLNLTAGTATLTITDNDDAPTAVGLAVSPSSVAESANATSITVTASLVGSQRTSDTAVTVTQSSGTATSGTDYAAISDFTVTIAAGAMSGTATLSFDPTEDTIDEANETVVLTGSAPSALSLTAGTATLTITDNDAAPTAVNLAVAPSSVAEGANATSITVTASLNGSQRTEATAVTVTQSSGTATSGTDYAAISDFTVTIAAGAMSGTATLSFDPTEDTIDEANETVVLTGSAPSALSLTAGTATLTITDNDDAPTAVGLAVSPSSVAESANATSITVTASLVGSQRTSDTAVTVTQSSGTATSGTDYTAISDFTVTIAAGASSGTATLSFDPTEDTIDEANETVVLTGSAPSGLNLTAGSATLTITDNDDAPTAVGLAVSPASVAESANATSITVTASLVGSQRTSDTAVTVTQSSGTATSGTDYAAISDFTVTIAAGAMSGTATLSFDPTEDTIDEANETVVLTGSAPSALSLTAGTATLTITDNDDAPTAVGLAVSPSSVAESANATSITVTASLVGSQRTEATAVTVTRSGGTATSGTDYAAISDFTVTIAAGASSGTATLSFDPTEDMLDEANETVVLTGSAPSGLNLTAGSATLTITDNDDAPTAVGLAVSPSSVAESANATSITVTASLVGSQRTSDTAVTVTQSSGTATSGTDYAAISDFTVTIAAGASSGTATLSFDPTEDMLDEANETVVLTGSAPSGLNLTAGSATLTITDNDDAPTAVGLAVSPSSVAESANATSITVTASLVGSQRTSDTAVTVTQSSGTATSGTDYAAISDFTVTIAAGAMSGTATLSFDPTEDTIDEDSETVVLTGSAPSALSLTAGSATLTITDNDDAPTAVGLAVSPSSVAESANATSITVTASLVGSQRTEATEVTVTRSGGTATSGTDYAAISDFTVTIAAGAMSGTATLSFDPTEDTIDEANETVVLTGSAPSALSLTAGTATLTITDNDAAPTAVNLAVAPSSVAEGANATSITVTASLNGSQRTEATEVTVTQSSGTATSGTDYAAISDFTVTIAAGASSGTATLSFDPTEDMLDEANETVILTGAAPSGLGLSAGTATLTITDNDDAPTAVTLGVSPASALESASATSITVTASLVGSQRTTATAVTVSRTGGTATSGTDYAAITAFTVTIAAGASSGTATLSFDPTEDTVDEDNETVVLTGTAPSSLNLTAGTATLTITDNDGAPTAVTLGVSPASAAESASATNITVTASLVGSQRTVATEVTVSQTGGTATSGTDYAAISAFTVTIAAGASSGTATLSFDPTEDTVDEENETVILTGTATGLTAGTTTLTITDNDDAPTAVSLAVSPASALESASATSITVTASLTGSQRTTATEVTVSRTGGTATSGSDYAAISAFTVTIAAGASSGTATLSFDPTEDTIDEDNETVVLTGTAPSSLNLTAGTATLTITDNDGAPTAVTLGVSPSSAAESASATNITVTASLVGSQRTVATEVTVSRTGGTATSGTDYAAISAFTVTIAAGASSGTATLSFDPTEDTVDEDNETVILTGTATGLTAGTATLTITDNDDAPTAVSLAVSPASALESASATSITVTASLTGSQRTTATEVTVSQTGGTATSGTDYAAISNFTVTIAAGASSGTATLSFDPTEDTLAEVDETVVLTGSAPSALNLTAGTATLTITDNDSAPTAVTLAVSPSSAAESASATNITVTASLTGSQRSESTAVTVSQTGGTATSGTDYATISNFTVTIAAGASSGTATLSFDPTEDTLDESDETVVLTGSAPSALSLTAGTATLTITDNDAAPTAVTLAVSPNSVAEGANATNITVTASLTGSQRTAATAVTVTQSSGTATSGTDYAAISAFTVTIAAEASSGTATLSFVPTEDTLDEDNETVVLTGTAAGLTAGTATLTITDNDDAPTAVSLAVSPASVAEGANATSITVTASLVGSQRTEATAVTVTQSGGTATSGTDYEAISAFTVTIAAGATSGTATLSFVPTEDTFDEDNETVVLTGTAAGLTAGTATLTISDNDNDLRPTFSPANNTTTTNAGTDITLTFPEPIRKDNANTDFADADLSGVLTLKRTGATGTDIPYAATINSAKTIITVNPAADLPEGAVHVGISDAYFNAAANQGQAASATFTVDTTGPAQPAFDPANAATVTNAGRNITLTFREMIRRTTSGAEFTTEAQLKAILALTAGGSSGADIAYAASINSGRTVITIDPAASLSDGDVHVAVTDGYYDVHGNRGHAASATFTVDTTLAGTPPLIRTKPEPLQLALWTDKPGYVAGETVRLFHTLRRHDDRGQYRAFAWLEPAGGGGRRYLAPLLADAALHAEAVDTRGLPEHAARARLLPQADRALVFEGEAPAPGHWRFVLELRPGSADEQYEKPAEPMRTRRAWAAFTVAERSQVLTRRGFDREIRADLTLRSDTLHYLRHQLFVRDGATLTIEPGTVVLGWGRNTAIIVETGGRIVAEGTREAPVVLGCSAPVGQREPGCWGGLRILGKAPVTRLEGVPPGVLPAGRAVYGGADAEDSSGVLRHVRVEFAGAAGDGSPAAGPALGLYGAGSGTVLDHIQTHASLGDGFAFHGGTSVCDHCVASGSGGAGLSWRRGWRGGASHLYVQHGSRGLDGLAGRNDDQGHDLEPRSLPTLSNVTLVHTFAHGARERKAVALRLSTGSGVRARDLLAIRFLDGAIDARGRSALLFDEGGSSVSGALLHLNGDRQLEGGIRDAVEFIARDPQLRDERWFANPDPRPKAGSPALHSDGEGYIGAFGRKENWLEGWTVFGPESAYDTREGTADER